MHETNNANNSTDDKVNSYDWVHGWTMIAMLDYYLSSTIIKYHWLGGASLPQKC